MTQEQQDHGRRVVDKDSEAVFQRLHDMFQGFSLLEGTRPIAFRLEWTDGQVYVDASAAESGDVLTVQWFGQSEPFGFMMLPNGTTWGPYHLH